VKLGRATASPAAAATRHGWSASRITGLAVAAALAVALLPAAGAQADPTPEQAQKNVADLNKQMEVTTEQYNDARASLAASQARVTALEPRAKAMRAQLSTYQARLGQLAASAYYGGQQDVYSSILVDGSPQDAIARASYLDALSARQQADLDGLLAAKKTFDDAKAKVDQELLAQAKAEKTLRDKRNAINTDLAKWQTLAAQAGATGGGTGTGTRFTPSGHCVVTSYTGPASGGAGAALRFAFAQQCKMYEWGAAGPMTYDCSGLTMRAWGQAGVSMPHTARGQFAMFPKVSLSALRPGDLVMYGVPTIHHVAMYVGNRMIIDASTYGRPVAVRAMRYGDPIAGAVRPS
jgi:cell wall-associated NlpC family hydrolase